MNKFLTLKIWPRLTELAKKSKQSCVAVAYLGNGAIKLLPLKAGGRLVVDLSENAVKSGQTSPHEILKFIARGVNVSTVGNLHAKIFVFSNHAFVGSANASSHSANALIEAMIETTDKSVVSACRQFVESMSGEIVTPEYAKWMAKLYRPPRFASGRTKTKHSIPWHPPLWVIPLVFVDWDSKDRQQETIGIREAKRKLDDSKIFEVKTFRWEGPDLKNRLELGQMLVELTNEKRGRLMVSPPQRVLSITSYKEKEEIFQRCLRRGTKRHETKECSLCHQADWI